MYLPFCVHQFQGEGSFWENLGEGREEKAIERSLRRSRPYLRRFEISKILLSRSKGKCKFYVIFSSSLTWKYEEWSFHYFLSKDGWVRVWKSVKNVARRIQRKWRLFVWNLTPSSSHVLLWSDWNSMLLRHRHYDSPSNSRFYFQHSFKYKLMENQRALTICGPLKIM